jgi:DNA-binding XRE family transcriptional regulator
MIMPRKVLPRIVSVSAGRKPCTLTIAWDSGEVSLVGVSGLVQSFRFYAPLRDNPKLFRQVQVGEYGVDIIWPGGLDMSNDTLWRLAQEQSGATMTAEAFRDWRKRHAYTLDEAAKALGLSRRMVAYYEQGERPIPRLVALATRALEAAE